MPSAYPCRLCDLFKHCKTVCMAPSCPMGDPAFAVVGEAPGEKEDLAGTPFVGPSGRLLWDSLAEHRLYRNQAFITNAVKCRPVNNLTPTVKQRRACQPYLDEEIRWLAHETTCRVVLALGSTAFQSLGGKGSITQQQGIPYEYRGVTVVPALHPAAALRSPKKMEDFKRVIHHFARLVRGEQTSFDSEVILVNG